MKPETICEAHAYLNTQKANLANFFQEVVDYVLPDRSNVTRWETPGQRRGIVRYDSTAVDSCEILAGNMAATLTPMGGQWMNLGIADETLEKKKSVKTWLQECTRLMLGALAKSNFYLALDEVYLDLCGFCTAAVYSEMIGTRLHFSCWPIKDYVFTIGIDGRSDSVYRKFPMTPIQIRDRFQQHPGFKEFGPKVTSALDPNAKPETKLKDIDVIHAIYRRETYGKGKRGARNMPWASCYVNVDDKVILAEGGYEEMPVNIVRWRVAADDKGWGRGPGFTAMPTVRSLNAAVKMTFKALAKDLDPPLLVEDKAVIGTVRTTPNGITYIRRDARFEYLTSGQRMDLAQFGMERMEAQVRAVFYADHLRLPPPQGTPMTATEIQIRWELMERLLGPTLGRSQTELLNPVVERVFGLMMRMGQLPQPPQEVIDAELDIEYTGPLARAQQMPEVVSIERTYQTAANIATLSGDPSILMRLNGDKAVQRVATLYGYPVDALRDDDEVEQIMAQRAQQQQDLQQRQDAALAADMAAKAGKTRATA